MAGQEPHATEREIGTKEPPTMTYSSLPIGEITYPRYPENPPYKRIQPEWLHDCDFTQIQHKLQPGVPDIKFYLETQQPIDIQHARYALGLRVFQNVNAIETMLDWVGIEGMIREKTLTNWYSRVAKIKVKMEEMRPAMPSLALPYDLRRHDEEDAYDSEEDGEYELDDEYDASQDVADSSPNNVDTSMHRLKKVHQIETTQSQNNSNGMIKAATVAHIFWPLFNRMCIRDLNFLRLQMDEFCSQVSEDINWNFLLCEPCTDVSAMVFLYLTSVWQSRPDGKEDELAMPLIWSLAMQLRIILPSERILRVVEHRRAVEQIPGLLPISQW